MHIIDNKQASFNYFIEDTISCGLILEGWEVKSIRAKKIHMNQAYIFIKDGEVFLTGLQIQPLLQASTHIESQPDRTRKLLVNKKEINRLVGSLSLDGMTLVPLSLYWDRQWIKVKVGLCKGKKNHDKRESMKNKQADRDISRVMKQNRC